MASSTLRLAAILLLAASAVVRADRPIVHHGPFIVSMRDGEGLPPEHEKPSAKAKRVAAADRHTFDAQAGNNYEAALQARSCREFLATYLPEEVSFGDVRFYLKLVADADAELALEDGGDLKDYRRTVDIAYLIVSVDRAQWTGSALRFRKALLTMFLPMLRSLYGTASLYVTVYDGKAAVANANWKSGARTPLVEVN